MYDIYDFVNINGLIKMYVYIYIIIQNWRLRRATPKATNFQFMNGILRWKIENRN